MQNEMKRISVVMTVFGEENFLGEAIESVLQQTYSEFEFLIVVEYGAAEQTVRTVQHYAQKDSRIRVLLNDKRLGLAESLNVGIRESKGEYVARMDDDDISLPERFEKQLAFMDENRHIGICGGLQVTIRSGNETLLHCATEPEELKGEMLFGCQLSHTSVMFRRNLFIENGWFYDGTKLAEDFELWMRILADTGMANIDEVLVKHRYDVSNISLGKGPRLYHETISIIRGGIEKYFQISTDGWSEEVLFPWRKYPNYLGMAGLYRLILENVKVLQELDCGNRKFHLVEESAFVKVLMKRFLYIFGNAIKRMGFVELSYLFNRCLEVDISRTFKENIMHALMQIGVAGTEEEDLECAFERFIHIPAGHRIIIYGRGGYYKDLFTKFTKKRIEEKYTLIGVLGLTESSDKENDVELEKINEYEYDYILISNPSRYNELRDMLITEKHVKGKIGLLAQIGVTLSGGDDGFKDLNEYIVFGCGKYFVKRLTRIEQTMHICCICDNDSSLWGKYWEDKFYCISPSELYSYEGAKVLVAVESEESYRKIQVQLLEQGIKARHINEILSAEWFARGFAYEHDELNRMRACEGKRIVLLGAPAHSNLGDQAQTYCIQELLKEQYPDREVFVFEGNPLRKAYYFLLYMIRSVVREDDFILVHSGYHCTDLFLKEEYLNEKIVELFPEKKLLFMPQTIYFKTEDAKLQSMDVYNAHHDLTIMCRDAISYECAKQYYGKCNLLLYPDVVTSLIGRRMYKEKRGGILLCLRKLGSEESLFDEERRNSLADALRRIDDVCVSDTDANISYREIRKDRRKVIEEELAFFARFRAVVTDRYHGMIFSLIANTPVIVVSSSDHKLSSGVRWFPKEQYEEIYYEDDEKEICEIVKNIINKEREFINPTNLYDKYYRNFSVINELECKERHERSIS